MREITSGLKGHLPATRPCVTICQHQQPPESPLPPDNKKHYWHRNIRLILKLLAVWFVVAYGGGIIFVDYLNQFHLGGYPLGFWIAQQGSIYVFVALIFVYARAMNTLDDEYRDDD